jgi:hypothetical protein
MESVPPDEELLEFGDFVLSPKISADKIPIATNPNNMAKQPIFIGLLFFLGVSVTLPLIGRPQFGQDGASSETLLPQSGHLIKAMGTS